MDFLAQKKEYCFKNIENQVCRVHTHLAINNNNLKVWRENDDKKSRKATKLIMDSLQDDNKYMFPDLVIVSSKYLKVVAAYDREKDVIYVNKGIYTHQIVKSHLKSSYFVAKDMRGILWHEYGYKLHWDAVKSFYKVHKSKYNDIY